MWPRPAAEASFWVLLYIMSSFGEFPLQFNYSASSSNFFSLQKGNKITDYIKNVFITSHFDWKFGLVQNSELKITSHFIFEGTVSLVCNNKFGWWEMWCQSDFCFFEGNVFVPLDTFCMCPGVGVISFICSITSVNF